MAKLTEGDRVKTGRKGSEEYDTGVIHSIDSGIASVGWDSGCTTSIQTTRLRRTMERYSGGHRCA